MLDNPDGGGACLLLQDAWHCSTENTANLLMFLPPGKGVSGHTRVFRAAQVAGKWGGRCAPGPTDPGPETGPAATHRGFFSPEWYPQGGLPGNLPNVQGLVTTPHIRGLLQTWVTG